MPPVSENAAGLLTCCVLALGHTNVSRNSCPVEELPGTSGYVNLLLSRTQQTTFSAAWEGTTSYYKCVACVGCQGQTGNELQRKYNVTQQSRDRPYTAPSLSRCVLHRKLVASVSSLKH